MPSRHPNDQYPKGSSYDTYLKSTTYKVYRYLLRRRDPVSISQVQKDFGFSSPSVSEYHLKKLLQLGLAKEEQGGYVVDKVILENIVRIRRISIPTQVGRIVFFGVLMLILMLFLRPEPINSLYVFAVIVNGSALLTSSYETIRIWKGL